MTTRLGLLGLLTALTVTTVAADITSPWNREKTKPDASQGAIVAQTIGLDSWVQFTYHRPAVNGRDVWTAKGNRDVPIVPRGGEPFAWRAGANEATTIEFTDDVTIEGEALPAGRYALFMIPGDETWTLVFNSQADQWGSYQHDAEMDVLRVDVAPGEAPHQEWLAYGFDDPGATGTTAWLHWADVKVPFRIELAGEG